MYIIIFYSFFYSFITTITHIIIAIGQIQRRLVLHVSQHCVGTRLAEEIGDVCVLPPHRQVQRRAAVEHGSVHVGPSADQKTHQCDVMQLDSKVQSCFPTGSFLKGL